MARLKEYNIPGLLGAILEQGGDLNELGVDPRTMDNWFSGEQIPTKSNRKNILKLARKHKIKVSEWGVEHSLQHVVENLDVLSDRYLKYLKTQIKLKLAKRKQ